MANGEEKNNDFYAVLGLNKECTQTELRTAYKKLALRWHPDRCSASANSKFVEQAKKKFQAIQQAYSVLSDANKRFLYDVGVYDSDDDENGMGDFLNEMTAMMSSENGEESFEELQELFEKMFQADIDSLDCSGQSPTSCSASSSFASYGDSSGSNNRSSSEMSSGETMPENIDTRLNHIFLGLLFSNDGLKTDGTQGRHQATEKNQRRNNRRSRR
ncbi:uncharacterized protein LOC108451878 isoform X2 [Gossypium arboreum]|uniref:uncharacterized protein LOC108451878 isoform X2 n=1 Tax=Gossypium arboreum TaxID=29729 RepID=UPI0022F1D917|nr:uncharacterized protein LOC108451878 isoform X2 [Gossypium arboreum]